jgi:hypothetical protein
MTPMRATMVGPLCLATRRIASTPVCHSASCCSAFGASGYILRCPQGDEPLPVQALQVGIDSLGRAVQFVSDFFGPSFRRPTFLGVDSPPPLSSVVRRVSVQSFPLRLQPICNCFSLIFLKITCSCLARERTAVSVRFIRMPIALELRPVGANFRGLSSSDCPL